MDFSYYHVDCPTCKNMSLIMVEQAEAECDVMVDKKYIWVLPDVWGEEAKRLGGEIPFLYNTKTGECLHVNPDDKDMLQKIKDFLSCHETQTGETCYNFK